MANLLDRSSLVLTPTAYNNGEALCIKPDDASGDFTFSRNSAATRVNAQGLVENVQILSSNLVQNGDFSEEGSEEVSNGSFSQEGVEQITNGSFDTDSDWLFGGSASISNGSANFTGSGDLIRQNATTPSGTYKITFTVTGTGYLVVKNYTGGVSYKEYTNISQGEHTIYVEKNEDGIMFQSFGFASSIDNVSVREVGQDWTLGTGWSIGEDKAVATNASVTYLASNQSLTIGKTYKITYTISDYVKGKVRYRGSSGTVGIGRNANGTYTEYLTTDTTLLRFQAVTDDGGFTGSITNISVKEVGQNWNLIGTATITENQANIVTASAVTGISQTNILTIGESYKLTYNIVSNNNGGLKISGNEIPSVVGNNTYYFEATATALEILRNSGATDITLTNISVIEITDDTNLPRINYEGFSYQDALGSELVTNGSFDVNGNWTNFGTPLVSEQSSTKYYTAPFSWYVNGDAYRQGIFSPNNFTLTNGKTYNVSLWVYALDGAEILSGLTNTDKSVFTSHAINQNEWTNITYSAIANATSASYISILTSSSTLEFYVDNVSVKEYLGQEVVPDSGCGSWLFESRVQI